MCRDVRRRQLGCVLVFGFVTRERGEYDTRECFRETVHKRFDALVQAAIDNSTSFDAREKLDVLLNVREYLTACSKCDDVSWVAFCNKAS